MWKILIMWTGHPLTRHICVVQFVHARTAQLMRLDPELHVIFARQKESRHLVCCMSHPWLFSRSLSFMSTSSSSSSPTYPTTHEEHSVHPAHLQALSVDKLWHQESLWREDLQSGGNPRTPTR